VGLRRRGFGWGSALLALSAVISLGGALLCLLAFYMPALHMANNPLP